MGAAVAAVSSAGSIIQSVESIFGSNGFPQQKTVIDGWVTTISANLAGMNNPATAAGDAWLRLRCWSGDNSVITAANTQELFGGPRTAAGCGCETAHGCRDYAIAAVTAIKQKAAAQSPLTGLGGGLSAIFSTTPSSSTSTTSPLLYVALAAAVYFLFIRKN